MEAEEWLKLIEAYRCEMKRQGYSESTIKYEVMALRRILRLNLTSRKCLPIGPVFRI